MLGAGRPVFQDTRADKTMRILALMTVRNEARYLARCLSHLEAMGVDVCLIDNGSTDDTVAIAESFLSRNVVRIEHLPYEGFFALRPILENEERLANSLDYDWFIHHDADEIREAPAPFRTLKEGIEAADAAGFNAINFDEFVFVPTVEAPDHTGGDYVATMRHYYLYEPRQRRRINAWKKQPDNINLTHAAGHRVEFEGRNVYPESFIMRHYIALSHGHAIAKYCGRVYSEEEFARHNWHGSRVFLAPEDINLPRQDELTALQDGSWDRSCPRDRHEYLGMAANRDTAKAPQRRHGPLGRLKLGLVRLLGAADSTGKEESFQTPFVATSPSPTALPAPFVVGVGRSGTTLLRMMLDAHPDLAVPWETHFLRDVRRLGLEGANDLETFRSTVVEHASWADFHIDADVFERSLKALPQFSCAEGLRTFYRLYTEKFGKSRWGDKTPPHDSLMKELSDLLPEARFIHLIRDGRDVALSYRGKWFGPGDDMKAQAAAWMSRIRRSRRLAQKVPHYLEIRYEDLVAEPEKTLRQICEFIELPWSEQMLNYHMTAEERLQELVTRRTPQGKVLDHATRASVAELTKKPPQTSRIGRWRRDMSEEERREFESVAGDMLRDLGY